MFFIVNLRNNVGLAMFFPFFYYSSHYQLSLFVVITKNARLFLFYPVTGSLAHLHSRLAAEARENWKIYGVTLPRLIGTSHP